MQSPLSLTARPTPLADSESDIAKLLRKWHATNRIGETLPPYEDIMLGSLGRAGSKIVLLAGQADNWTIVRAGAEVPLWLGREERQAPLTKLTPDCALALSAGSDAAISLREPSRAHAHFARDGFVQSFELVALPLENRWGDPFVAVYVGEQGVKYSLVDAIFRSTEEGVIALAAIRGQNKLIIDFQIVDLNAGAARLLRRPAEALRWRRVSEGDHAFNSPDIVNRLLRVIETGKREAFEVVVAQKSDDICINMSLTAMGDLICATLTDVTELKRREQSSRLLFEQNPMPMWIFNVKTRSFLSVNDAAVRHYGYTRSQFLSMSTDDICPTKDVERDLAGCDAIEGVFQSTQSISHLRADGSEIAALSFGRRIDYHGEDAYLVAIVDVTERNRAEAKVAYLAHHDSLTGLPNRVLYREQLAARLLKRGFDADIAILCLDLDLFKNVNDSYGHPIGDRLLQQVAERIRANLKKIDLVARLGGDEFVVILDGISDPQDAGAAAARLIEAIKAPFCIDGFEIVVGASIGIAFAPRDGLDADELLKNADMALYRAKGDGRGVYHFFEKAMDEQAQRRRAMETNLRKALIADEFELHYQPLVDLGRNQVVGFECLLRWRKDGKLISPSEFIPLAEATGLINPIGEWILHQACKDAATWPGGISLAVNLSPVQFRDPGLLQIVTDALLISGLAPQALELEITESVLLAETDYNLSILHKLKAIGIRISMDDFGTGYSSLSYLKSFPFDKIKIDRSFISEINDKPDCMAIVRAIAGLGKSLGIRTTAEGVETREQLDLVRREGCSEVQGYFYSSAKPLAELVDLIKSINAPARQAKRLSLVQP